MRKHGRLDQNQTAIVKQLRQLGASVCSLANLGQGAPDLLVGLKGKNFLFELKNPDKPPSQRKLTEQEGKFQAAWQGQIHTVEKVEQILVIIGAI